MEHIPAIAFSAWSGTGKTSLMEKLIAELKARNLRVAAVKHDAHRFEIDKEGKDSWRFSRAGADMSIISSAEKTAIIENREQSLSNILAMVHDVDIILVEGWKNEALPRIGICRQASGFGLPEPPENYIAIVSDLEFEELSIPCFDFDQIVPLADFIMDAAKSF